MAGGTGEGCVSEKKREGGREREKDRERERKTEREREREREREKETERQRETERKRKRDKDRDRETSRQTNRQTYRDREPNTGHTDVFPECVNTNEEKKTKQTKWPTWLTANSNLYSVRPFQHRHETSTN